MGQSVARLVLPPLLPPGSRGEGRPVLDELVSYGDLMNRRMEDRSMASETNDHHKEEEEKEEKEVVKGQKTLDLNRMPPELAISVLRHLGATDLCLASCVWQQLASDNILWQGLCRSQWHYASIYESEAPIRYRNLFLQLDEGTLTFNSDAEQGMRYFISRGLVADSATEIAKFIHGTTSLARAQVRRYVQDRQKVGDHLVRLQNYTDTFLPIALRRFFAKLEAPESQGSFLQRLLEQFSVRFCQCNPSLAMSVDSVYVMCFSLILLSVDLSSPHVKNKMSKREFIRNTRGAVGAEVGRGLEEDLYGSLYDNIFLRGHIADEERPVNQGKQQFVPGYLALFL